MTAKLEIVMVDSTSGVKSPTPVLPAPASQPGAPVTPPPSDPPRRPDNTPIQPPAQTASVDDGVEKALDSMFDQFPALKQAREASKESKDVAETLIDAAKSAASAQKVSPPLPTAAPAAPGSVGIPPVVAPPVVTPAAGGAATTGAAAAGGVAAGEAAAGGTAAGGAAMAAVANPVGIAVAAAVVSIGALAFGAKLLDDKFQGLADTLTDWNGDLLSVQATREVRMMELEQQRANRLGGDLANIQEAKGNLDEAMYRLQTEIYDLLLRTLGPTLETLINTGVAGVEGVALIKESVDVAISKIPGSGLDDAKELEELNKQFARFGQAISDAFLTGMEDRDEKSEDPDVAAILNIGITNNGPPPGAAFTPPVDDPFFPAEM